MTDSLISQLTNLVEDSSQGDSVVDLPDDAPFDPQQRQWLNGLLTGIKTIADAAGADTEDEPGTPLSILYGSQSGNCEVLSKTLKKYAATQGFEGRIEELDGVDAHSLAELNHVLIVCSTFGEGEPPDNAKNFYNTLMSEDFISLPPTLNYSVCGLGDSSYAHFNKCGQDIFERLKSLGAMPCHDFIACDLAFEDDFEEWKNTVFQAPVFIEAAGAASSSAANDIEAGPVFTKNTPFVANLITAERLSGDGSSKCVNHIEISLAGGGDDMHYEVGDALGVWPLNCPMEVNAILEAGGYSGREVVQQKSGAAALKTLLLSKLDISSVNAKTLEVWGLSEVPEDYQVVDILSILRPGLEAQRFVDGLRPIQPRLYSIASSPKAHPGEVHLTVGEVHFQLLDKPRKGVASTWLGQRLTEGSNIGVYVQSSAHFHIPSQDDAPLIMIGPGTGIAPFRAFLEEREQRQAQGKNWLFFGDQHQDHDFLYREQIETWQNSGLISQLSLAWSRDTDKKIYVQTLILERGAEFFQWLEDGAYIYICGDASRMAADVDKAIREVIRVHGGQDEAGVGAYIDRLVSEHRYQRDVY